MKYKKIVEEDTGWSEWIAPKHKGYKMACCDCGLVHNINFRVFKIAKKFKDGRWIRGKIVGGMHVEFQAQRNRRSTAQLRRHKKTR